MTQVFVHSMEDLWLFEFHPSKQGLSARLEKENKEKMYNIQSFQNPDGSYLRTGYLDVLLKFDFLRYVLLKQDSASQNARDGTIGNAEEG